jgi:hypothetical protein
MATCSEIRSTCWIYVNGLCDFLSTTQPFASQLGKEDPGVTGNFEVTFLDAGQMIHSGCHLPVKEERISYLTA